MRTTLNLTNFIVLLDRLKTVLLDRLQSVPYRPLVSLRRALDTYQVLERLQTVLLDRLKTAPRKSPRTKLYY